MINSLVVLCMCSRQFVTTFIIVWKYSIFTTSKQNIAILSGPKFQYIDAFVCRWDSSLRWMRILAVLGRTYNIFQIICTWLCFCLISCDYITFQGCWIGVITSPNNRQLKHLFNSLFRPATKAILKLHITDHLRGGSIGDRLILLTK